VAFIYSSTCPVNTLLPPIAPADGVYPGGSPPASVGTARSCNNSYKHPRAPAPAAPGAPATPLPMPPGNSIHPPRQLLCPPATQTACRRRTRLEWTPPPKTGALPQGGAEAVITNASAVAETL
jgi:hypothetical protein